MRRCVWESFIKIQQTIHHLWVVNVFTNEEKYSYGGSYTVKRHNYPFRLIRNFVLPRRKKVAVFKYLKNIKNVPGKRCAVKLRKFTGEDNTKCTLNTTKNKQNSALSKIIARSKHSAKHFFPLKKIRA